MQTQNQTNQTHYLMNFCMLGQYDVDLLCHYKIFVESTIIDLGEDWRIQSGLLSQEIVAELTHNPAMAQQNSSQRLQFNIFNEFLHPFLKQKIGQQKQSCFISESIMQEQFTQDTNKHFYENHKIIDSLTFKTLSLGFFIKAIQMWNKCFENLQDDDSMEFSFIPLGILEKDNKTKISKPNQIKSSMGVSTVRQNLSNMDVGSCQQSFSQMNDGNNQTFKTVIQKKWIPLKDLSDFDQNQIKGIVKALKKGKQEKIQVISSFAVNIHEIVFSGKKIRLLSTSYEFYRLAFIVWLIFNIKLFFSITFEQYLTYFQKLMKTWSPELQVPLKKFYVIIQKQWNLLLKDYSVALHDDQLVLKSLIKRVRSTFEQIWKNKQQQIFKKLS